MKNIYLKKDTIFSIGKFSEGYGYFMFFLKKNKFIQSCLDIGCGNGNLLKLMNKKSLYLGLDSNAGIYKKKKNKKIKYFDNGKQVDEFLNKLNKKFEIVTLMDVLEHTDTFVDLFKKSLKKSSKFVMVGLPNEDCLLSRFEFLIGKGIKTHGLEMVGTKHGHKHQWLIQFKKAKEVLGDIAEKNNFKLKEVNYFITLPKTFYKRIIYKFILFFTPVHLRMNNFCLIFEKK